MNQSNPGGVLHPLTLFHDAINKAVGQKKSESGCKNGCVDCPCKSGGKHGDGGDKTKEKKEGGCDGKH